MLYQSAQHGVKMVKYILFQEQDLQYWKQVIMNKALMQILILKINGLKQYKKVLYKPLHQLMVCVQ